MAFEFIPFTQGRFLTYAEHYAIFASLIFFFLGIFAFILSFLATFISRKLSLLFSGQKKIGTQLIKDSEENTSSTDVTPTTPITSIDLVRASNPIKSKIGRFFTWIGFTCWLFVPVIYSAFNVIHPIVSAGILYTFLSFKLLFDLYVTAPSSQKSDSLSRKIVRSIRISYQNHRRSTNIKFFFIVLISTIIPAHYQDICFSSFNGTMVGLVGPDELVSVSTRFSRSMYLTDMCPPGPPCHVFATLPEDASSSALINIHTSLNTKNLTVYYAPDSELEDNDTLGQYSIAANSQPISEIEDLGKRTVHIVYIPNLKPDTMYRLQIFYEDSVQVSKLYRTLPGRNSNRTVRLAQGGDVGVNTKARAVTSLVYSQDPDAILIGGDNAYDNGMSHCYFVWDHFYWMFETENEKIGRIVPFLMSTGNHDVGLESEAQRPLTISDKGPWFLAFMAQHTQADANNASNRVVPAINQRRTYSYHLLGNSLVFNLDTGYLAAYAGEQTQMIDEISSKYSNYFKMAVYHDPIYSACGTRGKGEEHWVPYFDKHHFLFGLENHRHAFKRTKPLVNSKVQENGTIYLGDGSWGVHHSFCFLDNSTGFMNVMANNISHFWMLHLNQSAVSYRGISDTALTLDFGVVDNVESYIKY